MRTIPTTRHEVMATVPLLVSAGLSTMRVVTTAKGRKARKSRESATASTPVPAQPSMSA